MGKPCDPKNVVASVRAKRQTVGDIVSEAERVNKFNGEQRANYEYVMANRYGIKARQPKTGSAWDAYKPKTGDKNLDKVRAVVDDQNYALPSEMFSKKFYGAFDRRLEAFEQGGDKSAKAYKDMVGDAAREVQEALNHAVMRAGSNKAKQAAELSRFGLNADNVYAAKEYLHWLADGGHTKKASNKWYQGINDVGSNLSKAQAGFQLLWTMGNGVDMIRSYSHYLTRKSSSVADVIKGTAAAMKASNGNIFRRIPALEKAGAYGSLYIDRGGKNLTPFEMSITAQKNLVWYLDIASGGNGHNGIKKTLFDSKPWDRPAYDRSADGKLLIDLARYPINETRWFVKTAVAAAKGDQREAANLLVYGLARTLVMGAASNIPAPIWAGMSEEEKAWWKNIEKHSPTNLIKHTSRAVFAQMGIDAQLDLGEYTQPGGGTLGARAGSILDFSTKAGSSATHAVSDLAHGNVPGAALRGVETLSAAANLTHYGKIVKALGGINSTEFTRLIDTAARQAEDDFSSEDAVKREYLKAGFGGAVKKPDEDGQDGGPPSLPELPSLPKLQKLN